MRRFDHWTPRYIRDRLAEICYQRARPDHPWLTRAANQMLESLLRPSDVGLEFGSGRSTLWFAKRLRHLTSVESNPVWHARVQQMLRDNAIANVDHVLIPKDRDDTHGGEAAYVRIIEDFAPDSVDFALVDGVYRDFCALKVLQVLRPGAVLVIDNVNWYLPCRSFSPDSRTFEQGPDGAIWNQVHLAISSWRRIWTSSGVTDTAFFFKPFG